MNAHNQIPRDAQMLIHPPGEQKAGSLGVFCQFGRLDEVRELERERAVRVWEVRGIVSDHIPLAGDASAALQRPLYHLFALNESPLWIYLHSGGRNAIYYELVAGEDRRLRYIAVRVESRLPSNALLLAHRPLKALLDVLTRDSDMPLVLERLELQSPRDGERLLTEMLVPQPRGVLFGPLGGIIQAVPFAPYDALYREAMTNSSPFYRVLCAWKIYEGTGRIRAWIREQCQRRNIAERQPPDPEVDRNELQNAGLAPELVNQVNRAGELFERLADMRHAIAHFLIERDAGEAHVYLAEGSELHIYAMAASLLLKYAHRLLEDLRLFCTRHQLFGGGAFILPLPQNRDQFIVRAADHGLE